MASVNSILLTKSNELLLNQYGYISVVMFDHHHHLPPPQVARHLESVQTLISLLNDKIYLVKVLIAKLQLISTSFL